MKTSTSLLSPGGKIQSGELSKLQAWVVYSTSQITISLSLSDGKRSKPTALLLDIRWETLETHRLDSSEGASTHWSYCTSPETDNYAFL